MKKLVFQNIRIELKQRLSLSSLKKQFLDLIKEIEKKDIEIMFILPLLITFIFLLPQTIKDLLQLNIKNPIWWQYLTQSFIHNSWGHLSSNLFSYFLYYLLIIILVNKLKLKKQFYKLLLFLVISLPIISSVIQVKSYPILLSWLPNLQHSAGTSGVVSALAGFVIIFWAMYFSKINKNIIFDVRTSLFFVIYIALLFVWFYSQTISFIVILVLVLFLLFFLTLIYNFKKIFIEISKETKNNFLWSFFLIITPLLFFATPKIIFPTFTNLFKNGAFVDFFMHYIGIVYGAIVSSSYFIFINKKWRT